MRRAAAVRDRLADAAALLAMALAEDDTAVLEDLAGELAALEDAVAAVQVRMRLDGAYDTHGAVVLVRAAAPDDPASTVLAEALLRMYRQWADLHGLPTEVVTEHHASDVGLREATLVLAAPYAYGLLRGEDGRHAMTAADPFDHGRTRTGHALVEVSPLAQDDDPVALADEDLRVDLYCVRGPSRAGETRSTLHIRHLPTGIGVGLPYDRRARHRKAEAIRIIRSRLLVTRGAPRDVRGYTAPSDFDGAARRPSP
ncbi:PCRF domain-containing protein [Dactylosporangium sp. CA-152071]|uniref:PCRF domain-containing protein n=1 Tax=Dactylosporangium sp. CA-152071 TaxID=3239933 RepID=UPI003D8A5287